MEILCLPLQRFDFIGRVQQLDLDLAQVLQHLCGVTASGPTPRARTHARASERVNEAYGPEEPVIVNRLHAADFGQLGDDRHL